MTNCARNMKVIPYGVRTEFLQRSGVAVTPTLFHDYIPIEASMITDAEGKVRFTAVQAYHPKWLFYRFENSKIYDSWENFAAAVASVDTIDANCFQRSAIYTQESGLDLMDGTMKKGWYGILCVIANTLDHEKITG
ncbi:MAG: hypothetical protein MMC33_007803 [Icmadophila ericetorum]|nr:hypothetical protein [Icmadophila ericetorum]